MGYYDKIDSALCAAFKKAEIQSTPMERCVVSRWNARMPTDTQSVGVVGVAESNPAWVEDWMYDDK